MLRRSRCIQIFLLKLYADLLSGPQATLRIPLRVLKRESTDRTEEEKEKLRILSPIPGDVLYKYVGRLDLEPLLSTSIISSDLLHCCSGCGYCLCNLHGSWLRHHRVKARRWVTTSQWIFLVSRPQEMGARLTRYVSADKKLPLKKTKSGLVRKLKGNCIGLLVARYKSIKS